MVRRLTLGGITGYVLGKNISNIKQPPEYGVPSGLSNIQPYIYTLLFAHILSCQEIKKYNTNMFKFYLLLAAAEWELYCYL